uniref:Uncharacterized protein n=1 Tax=Arundo donax TaxID=35708 RepID=A0A0A8ZB61_ARUDO
MGIGALSIGIGCISCKLKDDENCSRSSSIRETESIVGRNQSTGPRMFTTVQLDMHV